MQGSFCDTTHLVAGGAGFLGSHLVDRLLFEGAHVVVIDSFASGSLKNVENASNHTSSQLLICEGDITEVERIRHFQKAHCFTHIWNLACMASPRFYQKKPVETLMTCVVGTKNLLDLARTMNSCFIQASTSEVYGSALKTPQAESYWGNVNPIGIRACYDEGKRAAETLCFDYHREYGVQIKVPRIFNTYGPRMLPHDGRVISNFIVSALQQEKLTIYGDGSQTRSFCFVSDLIDAFIRLVHTEDAFLGPINIGNPQEVTMNDLAYTILDLTHRPRTDIVYMPLPKDDPPRRCPDITLANSILQWNPQVSLPVGLIETIGYFTEHIHIKNTVEMNLFS